LLSFGKSQVSPVFAKSESHNLDGLQKKTYSSLVMACLKSSHSAGKFLYSQHVCLPFVTHTQQEATTTIMALPRQNWIALAFGETEKEWGKPVNVDK
jgi:hypothetical protein